MVLFVVAQRVLAVTSYKQNVGQDRISQRCEPITYDHGLLARHIQQSSKVSATFLKEASQ